MDTQAVIAAALATAFFVLAGRSLLGIRRDTQKAKAKATRAQAYVDTVADISALSDVPRQLVKMVPFVVSWTSGKTLEPRLKDVTIVHITALAVRGTHAMGDVLEITHDGCVHFYEIEALRNLGPQHSYQASHVIGGKLATMKLRVLDDAGQPVSTPITVDVAGIAIVATLVKSDPSATPV